MNYKKIILSISVLPYALSAQNHLENLKHQNELEARAIQEVNDAYRNLLCACKEHSRALQHGIDNPPKTPPNKFLSKGAIRREIIKGKDEASVFNITFRDNFTESFSAN